MKYVFSFFGESQDKIIILTPVTLNPSISVTSDLDIFLDGSVHSR